MKLTIFTALVSLSFGLRALAQNWEWQNPLPQGNQLSDVFFIDAANGWAGGNGGMILHTADGGANWTRQATGVALPVTSIEFVDSRRGWATTNQNWSFPYDPPFILRTTDGGATWQGNREGTGGALYDLELLSANDGWAVGAGEIQHMADGIHWLNRRPWDYRFHDFFSVSFGDQDHGWLVAWHRTTGAKVIIATADRGATWVVQHVAQSWLRFVDFVDVNNGWVVGDGANMLRTTDGGVNWTEQPAPDSGGLSYVHFLDINHGWVTGNDGVFQTGDGGTTWTRQDSSGGRLSMLDENTGWRVDGIRIARTTDGGASWQEQSHAVTTQSLASVHFLDPQHGWAAGNGGTVVQTTDGGDHWTALDAGTDHNLRSMYFVDAMHGWALSDGGNNSSSYIMRTTDGGHSWDMQPAGWGPTLNQLAFVDAMRGWAVGDSGLIVHTSDGGDTWSRQYHGSRWTFRDVDFVNANLGWVVGDRCWCRKPNPEDPGGWFCRSLTLRTVNGGLTWVAQDTSYVMKSSVDFVDADNGWVAGWMIQRTTDGGQSWIASEGDWRSYDDVAFVNADEGWVIDFSSLLHTTDGGVTWITQSSENANVLHGLAFFGTGNGWAVGEQGTILHYGGGTWAEPVEDFVPAEFTLHQNFPNPFNATTTLIYELPHAGLVSLRVFDLLGREVAVLEDRVVQAGNHRVMFDGSGLATGIYFSRLEAEEFSQTKKLILLK